MRFLFTKTSNNVKTGVLILTTLGSVYSPRDAKNKMICESVTISSELSGHSRAAAITSVLIVIDHLREKQHVPLKNNFIVWSDGFSALFQSQFVFKLLSRIDSCLNITWCYNERHHGKGPINGTGGTLKDCVYHDVMSGKCVIDIPKPFAEHVDETVKRITYTCTFLQKMF